MLEDERIEDAITVFELNVEENPHLPDAYSNLASAYLRRDGKEDRERALANYRKVLETNPDLTGPGSDALNQLRRDAEASILKLNGEKPDAE
jgi:tetratricopeptide (TPR) repeat protein